MEEPQETPKKAKRQLTPEQLEKLAAAREKANAVRKEKAAAKKKEKELLNMKAKQRQEQVDAEIAEIQKPIVNPKNPPKQKKKANLEPVIVTDSETSDEEYEQEDESSSSSEEEIVYVRKKAPQRKRAPKSKVNFATDNSIDDIYNQRMQHAFGSLFPQF